MLFLAEDSVQFSERITELFFHDYDESFTVSLVK